MAVGIGLVFGVLRLVNFAYGQLVMAGAYALAFASERGWPVCVGIVLCFAVVLALSLLMDRIVFRPLRGQSPAVMLVATFAVAFLLQSIALLWFGPLGKIAASLASLNRPVDDLAAWTSARSRSSRRLLAAGCLLALVLLLGRTRVGLHMRAAAMDFRTARAAGRACGPGHRRRRADLGTARRRRRGDAHGANTSRHAGLRACGTRSSFSPASCSAA